MIEYNVKTNSIRNGIFSFVTDKKYAVLYPEKNGIRVIASDKPDKKAFVRKVRIEHAVKIPERLLLAYGLDKRMQLEKIKKDEVFIHAQLLTDMPAPLKGVSFSTPKKEFDMTGFVTVRLSKGKLSFPPLKEVGMAEISIHIGTKQYIEIAPITDVKAIRSNIPSLKSTEEEYGKQLIDFVGEGLTYIQSLKSHNTTYTVPRFFLENTETDPCGKCRIKKMADGHIVILPPEKTCAIDEEKLETFEKNADQVRVCEECAEHKDEIGEVTAMLKEILNIASSLKEENKILSKEIEDCRKENAEYRQTMERMKILLAEKFPEE